jgi:thioredoxin
MDVIDVSDTSFEKEVLQAKLPVVVDVWAPWCGPCKIVGPALRRIHESDSSFKLVFANMEDFPETAKSLSIKATPTLLVFRNGEEVARRSGAMMQGQIQQWLDQEVVSA